LSKSDEGEVSTTWQFNDWTKAVGGVGFCKDAVLGDEMTCETYAPATQVEEVTPGEGSVILYDTGLGFNAIIPYAGGTHDIVEGSEVPVPVSVGEDSYWSWSAPDFGKGEVTPQEGGGYGLYDGIIPLSRHAARIQLLGSRQVCVETGNVEPLIVLPHWVGKATLRNGTGGHTVEIIWSLKLVRKRTTKEW
jgi:hypothetical protein